MKLVLIQLKSVWRIVIACINFNNREMNNKILFIINLLFIKWNNYELREVINTIQLKNEKIILTDLTNKLLKQFFSYQCFDKKEIYHLNLEYAKCESRLAFYDFTKFSRSYLRYCPAECWIISEYWTKGIDNYYKLWTKSLNECNSLNYWLKWWFHNFKEFPKFIQIPYSMLSSSPFV